MDEKIIVNQGRVWTTDKDGFTAALLAAPGNHKPVGGLGAQRVLRGAPLRQ